jgi:uncharacterized protein YbcI
MTAEATAGTGHLAAEISTAVVRRLSEYTGRGPTKARTTMGQDSVFVVLEDTLTKGERTLAQSGEGEAVRELRKKWQIAMRDELVSDIERLTGRSVVAFMSDNHVDPDMAVEVFCLAPDGKHPVQEAEAVG